MNNPILPHHEQHFPSILLPYRLQEYVQDGQPATRDRRKAIFVTPQQVYNSIAAAQIKRNLFNIHPRYFVGTCFHESGCSNEWDTEIATASSPTGFVSVGAYQIGQEEANRFHYNLGDMLDLDKASDCMVQLAEANLSVIVTAMADAVKLHNRSSTTDYMDPQKNPWPQGGLRAYLGICHNHGAGYVRTTILNYGLNWPEYKIRNPHDNIVAHQYGEDCATGGAWYKQVAEATKTLP